MQSTGDAIPDVIREAAGICGVEIAEFLVQLQQQFPEQQDQLSQCNRIVLGHLNAARGPSSEDRWNGSVVSSEGDGHQQQQQRQQRPPNWLPSLIVPAHTPVSGRSAGREASPFSRSVHQGTPQSGVHMQYNRAFEQDPINAAALAAQQAAAGFPPPGLGQADLPVSPQASQPATMQEQQRHAHLQAQLAAAQQQVQEQSQREQARLQGQLQHLQAQLATSQQQGAELQQQNLQYHSDNTRLQGENHSLQQAKQYRVAMAQAAHSGYPLPEPTRSQPQPSAVQASSGVPAPLPPPVYSSSYGLPPQQSQLQGSAAPRAAALDAQPAAVGVGQWQQQRHCSFLGLGKLEAAFHAQALGMSLSLKDLSHLAKCQHTTPGYCTVDSPKAVHMCTAPQRAT